MTLSFFGLLCAELDDFEGGGGAGVDGEADEGALLVPSCLAGCARINVEMAQAMVGHHFEYVAVAAHHEAYSLVADGGGDAGVVAARVSGYVAEHHAQALYLEDFYFGTAACYCAMVDITSHGAHHGTHFLKSLDDGVVAYIAGVPYLVAVLEVECVAVVPI